jgi:hypothetical protein
MSEVVRVVGARDVSGACYWRSGRGGVRRVLARNKELLRLTRDDRGYPVGALPVGEVGVAGVGGRMEVLALARLPAGYPLPHLPLFMPLADVLCCRPGVCCPSWPIRVDQHPLQFRCWCGVHWPGHRKRRFRRRETCSRSR